MANALESLLKMLHGHLTQPEGEVPPMEMEYPLSPGTKPVSYEGRQILHQMVREGGEGALPDENELLPANSQRYMQRSNSDSLLRLMESLGVDDIQVG